MSFFDNTRKSVGFGGMTIYNTAQVLTALNQAGFIDAKVSKNDKGWICVTARK